jgi:carbohydrate kinase (thermoresistant glucokinase family)
MGVSGSGKSTMGRRLGATLDWPFRDADSFHPQANIDKMSRGIPLTDEDRAPWLAAIAAWIAERVRSSEPGIVSCSALKQTYRKTLLDGQRGVGLVYLKGNFALISDRRSRRKGHFMPIELLKSQFATLEEPAPEERALVVPVRLPPKKITERIIASFGLVPAPRVTTP